MLKPSSFTIALILTLISCYRNPLGLLFLSLVKVETEKNWEPSIILLEEMCNSELGTFCLSFSLRGCRKYALHTISGSLYTPDTKSTGMPFDTPRACFIAYFYTRKTDDDIFIGVDRTAYPTHFYYVFFFFRLTWKQRRCYIITTYVFVPLCARVSFRDMRARASRDYRDGQVFPSPFLQFKWCRAFIFFFLSFSSRVSHLPVF